MAFSAGLSNEQSNPGWRANSPCLNLVICEWTLATQEITALNGHLYIYLLEDDIAFPLSLMRQAGLPALIHWTIYIHCFHPLSD